MAQRLTDQQDKTSGDMRGEKWLRCGFLMVCTIAKKIGAILWNYGKRVILT